MTKKSSHSHLKNPAHSDQPSVMLTDAWDRFERAIDIALHTPAMHKTKIEKKPTEKASKVKKV
jgi:hypothetical protein